MLEMPGTKRETLDGRTFRYGYAGASDLAVGKLNQIWAMSTFFSELDFFSKTLNDKIHVVTNGATSLAIPENGFVGGMASITDGTGEGYAYPISFSSAVTTTSTTFTFVLEQGLELATGAAATISITSTAQGGAGMVLAPNGTNRQLAGVNIVPITANYYGWVQVGGMCNMLCEDTPAAGSDVYFSGSDDGAMAVAGGSDVTGYIGVVLDTGVNTEYKPVHLRIG